jgi:hypothetical protein
VQIAEDRGGTRWKWIGPSRRNNGEGAATQLLPANKLVFAIVAAPVSKDQ